MKERERERERESGFSFLLSFCTRPFPSSPPPPPGSPQFITFSSDNKSPIFLAHLDSFPFLLFIHFFVERKRERAREPEKASEFFFFPSVPLPSFPSQNQLRPLLQLVVLVLVLFQKDTQKKTMQASLAARPALRPVRAVAPRRASSMIVRAAPVRVYETRSGLSLARGEEAKEDRNPYFFLFDPRRKGKKRKNKRNRRSLPASPTQNPRSIGRLANLWRLRTCTLAEPLVQVRGWA